MAARSSLIGETVLRAILEVVSDTDLPMQPGDDAGDDARPAEELEAFDLDHDGKISLVESERARLGVVDARLEEIAEEGGLKGKLAEGVHRIVDKLDND